MRRSLKLPEIRQRMRFVDYVSGRLSGTKIERVFRHVDFRYYWIGAFLSFSGSRIQTVAEGYFVFQLTKDESKLAFVNFCASVPVFFFGFFAGSLSDIYDRRKVLIAAQLLFAMGALYLAA